MRRWDLRRGRRGRRGVRPTGVLPADKGFFSMSDAVPGKRYRIMRINGGCRLNSRLCAMGFIPGEVFYVSGASMGGPLCVIVKGTKFAIGRGMAERIRIKEI